MKAPKMVPHNFIPRDYQLEVFQALTGTKNKPKSKFRRVLLRWHRRAGKDKACWCFLIKEAAETPGNYFYVFPTKTEAKIALWENIDKDGFKLMHHLPEELIANVNNQEMLLRLTNGSTISVVALDKNPDGIRGIAARGIVFSEFAFSDPEAYKIVVPALEESKGWAIFNSTPNGRNHFYDLEETIRKHNSKWFISVLQTMWPDRENYSGLVSPEELIEIRDSYGYAQDEMEREYGVSYLTGMKGTYYADQIEEARGQNRITDFAVDSNLLVDTFWDLGIDDSTAVWFKQTVNNKAIFVDYYENSGKSLLHYAQMLADKGYKYRTHYLPHDARNTSLQTGSTTAEIFERHCEEYEVSMDVRVLDRYPVQDGINAVRKRFPLYYFNTDNCYEGIKKIELYHKKYDKRKQTYLKEPVHDTNSHAADALRQEALAIEYFEDPFMAEMPNKVDFSFDPLAI